MARRVVITGIGLVTPIAVGTEETWQGLLAGKSGIGPITHFDHTAFATHFAGEVKDFDPLRWMTAREAKTLDPFVRYAVAAGSLAIADSGLEITGEFAERVGCFVGAGLGGVTTIEATCTTLWEKGPRHGFSPFFVPMIIVNLASGNLSIRFGAKGPNLSHVSACSTGTHAIGDAVRRDRARRRRRHDLRRHRGDHHPARRRRLQRDARALHAQRRRRKRPRRPFDKDRDGFVIGEGAGILVLEELEHAKARGAKIYAEVSGYGANADAHHITAPAPGRRGRPALHAPGAQGRQAHAGGHRLHQRARHVDARSTTPPRRSPSRRVFGDARAQAHGQLDQVDDRPHAGRGRRRRERHLRAGDVARA